MIVILKANAQIRHMLFNASIFVRFLCFLNSLNKTLKTYWKWKENTGKVREICQSENVGTMLTQATNVCRLGLKTILSTLAAIGNTRTSFSKEKLSLNYGFRIIPLFGSFGIHPNEPIQS